MSLAEEEERQQAEAERPPAEQRVIEARRPDRRAPTPTSRARARPRGRRRLLLIGLIALLVIGVIVGGTEWWIEASKWVSTDDAFIDTHMVQISPQVAGRVKAVLVNDNQEVRAGQLLVEIDPADYQAKLDQALANQQSAQGQLAQATAQIPVATANVNEAKAQIDVAQAAAANAEIALKRDQMLARMGGLAVSQQTIDNDTATWRSDEANLAAARQKTAAAGAQIGLDERNIQTAEAAVKAAAAQVAQARLDLGYTMIRASVDGRIANKTVAVGDYLQVGQALMALVPDQVWVTANFKETELGEMKLGDPVDIYVDAYPGHVFKGHVQSIQPGSGAAFSLLPPENATGNYVKVVQRVPVKITFDDHPVAHWLLGPGMSVEPYVKIR
ncbi:MAG TPA: HlyD family secretion protein [Stellaceae bacterium]|nr:HlyD family secretion protein [Stellaceae bacterium]